MFERLYNHMHKMPRQVSSLGRFKPLNVAIVPAPLPLSYINKPKSLARRVFDTQVSHLFSDLEATEHNGGQDCTLQSGDTSKLVRLTNSL